MEEGLRRELARVARDIEVIFIIIINIIIIIITRPWPAFGRRA